MRADSEDIAAQAHYTPRMLLRTGRALCPTCGAALVLDGAARVECQYCGAQSTPQRRLRKLDPELVPGTDPALVSRPPTPFVPAHALVKGGRSQGQCPECAAPLELDRAPQEGAEGAPWPLAVALQGQVTCAHCGVRSKLELRLALQDDEGLEWARFEQDLSAVDALAIGAREVELRAALRVARLAQGALLAEELRDLCARRMLRAYDDAGFAAAASTFEPWAALNPWRERALTQLMRRAGSLGPEAQRILVARVVAPVAAAAWKHDQARAAYVRGVMRAAGRALYSPTVPAALLDAIGFAQPAASLKLLLEVAEWALAEGHTEVARGALFAAAEALDFRRGQYHVWRDKVDRAAVAEALMYRLLYLSPPLLAWTLDQLPRWQVADAASLVSFMEDCALERPELAPLLHDAGLARPAAAQTFDEYAAHLALLDGLGTNAARAALLRSRTFDPEGFDPAQDSAAVPGILARLLACLRNPALSGEASFELARVFAGARHVDLPGLHAFVREHWAELPEHPRAVYALHAPQSGLMCVPDVAALLSAPPPEVPALGTLAHAVAGQRDPQRQDYEARHVEDELEQARKACTRALEAARGGGGYGPSDTRRYTHECSLASAWLAYRATRDPRFKDVLASHEMALCALAAPRS